MQTQKISAIAFMATAIATASPAAASGLGSCYLRGDVGYGWSTSDKATATITPETPPGVIGTFGATTGRVGESDFDNAWFGEVGIGCALVRRTTTPGSIKDAPQLISTPTGFRADVTFGFHGSRDFDGVPVNPPPLPVAPPPPPVVPPVVPPVTPPPVDPPKDPVRASVRTNTLMFNLYYDFAPLHAFTPYVGAGIGVARVELDDVVFTNGAIARLGDGSETTFAWSLMAGVSTGLGRGVILDVGYRYLDLGDVSAGTNVPGFAFKLHDLSEHQVKVGVRIPLWLGR